MSAGVFLGQRLAMPAVAGRALIVAGVIGLQNTPGFLARNLKIGVAHAGS